MLQLDYAYTRYAHRRGRTPYLSGLVFVTVLHAILITALVNAIGPVSVTKRPPMVGGVLMPDDPDIPLPLPPEPVIDRPPPLPPPIVQEVIIAPTPGPRDKITEPVSPPAIPNEPPVLTIAEIPARAIESTQTGPTYPAISRRLREEGSVRLRLTIGTDGSVIDASVVSSCGFQRLDEAAMRWVRRNWRYEPAMRGDMPIEATAEATLTFRLE